MKSTSTILLTALIGLAFAEPPRFKPARFRFQRIELVPTTTESATEPTTDAPYPASGWKPAQPFSLPNEQTGPSDAYGPPEPQRDAPYPAAGWKPAQPFTLPQDQAPPATSYGAPDNTYGVPDNTYGSPSPRNVATTDNPQAEEMEKPVDVEVQKSVGEYYVLLPNGLLQKVTFATENDVQNMKYTTSLQLRKPAPVFVFGP